MKKSILITMTLFFLALTFPATGDTAYLIRLKNGGKFTTFKYWSEGSQIKFYIHGGVAGIEKDSVRKIEKTVQGKTIYRKPGNYHKTAEVSSETNDGENQKVEGKTDLTYYKEKKARLAAELARTLDRLREATRNRDMEAKERAKNEMRRVSDEISALTDEVKKKNNGKIPEDWREKK